MEKNEQSLYELCQEVWGVEPESYSRNLDFLQLTIKKNPYLTVLNF